MAARHDRQYNQGGVQMGGYEAAGGRDGSLVDDEIYRSVSASASLGNSGGYTGAVVGDGSGRQIYMGANSQQGGYNGAEMDGAHGSSSALLPRLGFPCLLLFLPFPAGCPP
jgi:hypothetical protein